MQSLNSEVLSSIPTAKENENYRYVSLRDVKWSELNVNSTLGVETSLKNKSWPNVFNDDFFVALVKNKGTKTLELNFSGKQQFSLCPKILEQADALQVESVVIRIQENAELDLQFNLMSSLKNSNHQILVIEVYLEKNARLKYFYLQDMSSKAAIAIRHYLELAQNTSVEFNLYHSAADKCQHRVDISLKAKGSHVELNSAQRLRDKQQMDLWVNSVHLDSDSSSQTTAWNVLEDEAVAVFNGNIHISHEGFRTQAFQSNKNLLLSSKAQVHTLPKLEISTDDVKCSHGASVASLDPAQLFYLESRGINQEQAERMLIEAYTYPVISKIPDEKLREKYMVTEEDLL